MLTSSSHFWWLRLAHTKRSPVVRRCGRFGHRNTRRLRFSLRKNTLCLKGVWNRTPLALRPSLMCGRIRCCVWQCGRRWWRCLREEWNHLSCNNKKGRREISYYNRFVCTQSCYIEANTWVLREKQAYRDKRKTSTALQCVSCTEVEILLKFYVFPLASLRFSFCCWISDTWTGEVKNAFIHFTFGANLHEFDGFHWHLILTPAIFEKFSGMCGLSGGCKFLSSLRWRPKCVMVSASTTERRKLLLCSAKRLLPCETLLVASEPYFVFHRVPPRHEL